MTELSCVVGWCALGRECRAQRTWEMEAVGVEGS